MPKPKSSRATVRNTPQPKKHIFVAAVFTDDFGRERALTVSSAASFSKKKLDGASRAIPRRSDREMERAIKAGDRETARAIRKLRKQERETDRSIARFFRRKIRTVATPTTQLKHRPPKPRAIRPSRAMRALPSYGGFIRDRQNRIGVFFDAKYFSSRTARPGVAMRMTKYIWNGSALDDRGAPMFRSNVGETIEEVVCGFDHLEQVNRSAQKGAKVLNTAVLAMDHRWTREQMMEVGEEWAEERFGQYGLPFAIALHEPPPDGDERNWHIHVNWSWRPLERIRAYEWLVSEALRTHLDGREGMRVLRDRFAALSTEMSFRRGDCDVYTGLSHAARGLPIEPQRKMYEEKTRRARGGEFVAANEENHERVLRSKAALIDDDLRREAEHLVELQEIACRAAARIAHNVTIPRIPSIAYRPAWVSKTHKKVSNDTRHQTQATVSKGPRAPLVLARPHTYGLPTFVQSLKTKFQAGKFANLRISELQTPPVARPPAQACRPHLLRLSLRGFEWPKVVSAVPLVTAPFAGFVSTVFKVPRQRVVPKQAMTPPEVAAPTIHPMPFVLKSPGARMTGAPPGIVTSAVAPAVPARALPIRTIKAPTPAVGSVATHAVMSAFPALSRPVPPRPITPPASATPRVDLTMPRRRTVPSTIASETWTALELTLNRALRVLRGEVEQTRKADAEADRKSVPPLRSANSPWLLFELLAEQRSLIVRGKEGQWVLPPSLANAAGLTTDQLSTLSMQRVLSDEAQKQQEELAAVADLVATDPRHYIVQTPAGWRLSRNAPEHLRRTVYDWRGDPQVQNALGMMSNAGAPPAGLASVTDSRRRIFLEYIYRRPDAADARTRDQADRRPAFPPPGWDGGLGF